MISDVTSQTQVSTAFFVPQLLFVHTWIFQICKIFCLWKNLPKGRHFSYIWKMQVWNLVPFVGPPAPRGTLQVESFGDLWTRAWCTRIDEITQAVYFWAPKKSTDEKSWFWMLSFVSDGLDMFIDVFWWFWFFCRMIAMEMLGQFSNIITI